MINIPISQSIRFRPVNSDPANFDNTFDTEGRYIQYVSPADLSIQLSRASGSIGLVKMYAVECNGTETEITDSTDFTISDRVYTTFAVPFADFTGKKIYIKVTENSVLTHESESVTVESQPNFLKLNWFNTENSFLTDYSNGLVNEMLVDARMRKLSFGGESSVYSNQGVDVKLKEIVSRLFSFECDVPDYIAEQITLAMAHDRFYMNEIEFVTSKKPTTTQLGTSNMYTFVAELKQKTVVGINTHDVG